MCNASAPELRAAHEQYRDQGFEVLSISIQEPPEDVEAFVAEHGLEYPFLLDRSGTVSSAYQLLTTPTTFFIAPDGSIQDVIPGMVSQEWLADNIEHALGA